jgi:hypothetical protein
MSVKIVRASAGLSVCFGQRASIVSSSRCYPTPSMGGSTISTAGVDRWLSNLLKNVASHPVADFCSRTCISRSERW